MASHAITTQSLDLLEARLRRLTFVLTGSADGDVQSDSANATTRLRTLDRQLGNLAAKSVAASQVLDLQHQRPSLFHPAAGSVVSEDLLPASLAALILAHVQQYHQISSQLSTLADTNVPDPTTLVPLVDLRSRIDAATNTQARLNQQHSQLRARSSALLETWHRDGCLEMSKHWTGWEEQLRDVEILVRRMEAAKRREGDMV